MKNLKKQLLAYSIKYKGEYAMIAKAIQMNEEYEDVEYDGNYLTILDNDYPKALLRLKNPPYVLYYEGNLNLLKKEGVAIVGSRIVSNYGASMTKLISNHLKHKYVIISGAAKGVDGLAHQCALDKATIAVLGCGLDIAYPKCNAYLIDQIKKYHLLISEYPKNVAPLKHHFPMRNRIVVGLAKALIVTAAKQNSGTMISVNEALELNMNVYVVPYMFNDQDGIGCNYLIQQGANILCEIDDVDSIS